jgi:Tol biopolymer transport system component
MHLKSKYKSYPNIIHTYAAIAVMIASFLALFCFSSPQSFGAEKNVVIDMQPLGRQPEGSMIYSDSLAFSPDASMLACVLYRDDYMQVLTNNTVGEKFDHIARGYPIISPAGNRVGYIADKKDKHFIVVDGKASTGYDGACCLRFSPNGKYMAYIAKEAGKQFVVLNGNRLKAYDLIDQSTGILFSPDSQTLAYIAKNNTSDGILLILNGKESPPVDGIKEVSFSPDSKETAYIISQDNDWYVIHNRVKEGPYDKAQSLIWSPDSTRLAYIAIKDGAFWVVNNNEKTYAGDYAPQSIFFKQGGFAAQTPRIPPPVFSPDSSRMAFTRIEEKKFRNVVGETTGPPFDQVSTVIFSPDSRHYAYIAVSRTADGIKMNAIHDNNVGTPHDLIDKPYFSPDSTKLAYRSMDKGQWHMVQDGKGQKPFDLVDEPVFSPDSAKLAYRARTQGKWLMVENGTAQKPYDAIGNPVFSPDSARLAYRAIGQSRLVMVVNNKERAFETAENYATMDHISRPFFSPSGQNLIYLALINPTHSLLITNVTEKLLNVATLTTIDIPLVFDADDRARFLAVSIKNGLFQAFQINITVTGQP